jgi:type III secretory pathway component EscR
MKISLWPRFDNRKAVKTFLTICAIVDFVFIFILFLIFLAAGLFLSLSIVLSIAHGALCFGIFKGARLAAAIGLILTVFVGYGAASNDHSNILSRLLTVLAIYFWTLALKASLSYHRLKTLNSDEQNVGFESRVAEFSPKEEEMYRHHTKSRRMQKPWLDNECTHLCREKCFSGR